MLVCEAPAGARMWRVLAMIGFAWRAGAVGLLALAGVVAHPAPAAAWWRGGVWIGVPPVVIGAPAYYPPAYYPPAYYPPYYYPPAYYPPPGAAAPQSTPVPQANQKPSQSPAPVAYGATCYAGAYVCAAPGATPVGSVCTCPALGAPSYGRVN